MNESGPKYTLEHERSSFCEKLFERSVHASSCNHFWSVDVALVLVDTAAAQALIGEPALNKLEKQLESHGMRSVTLSLRRVPDQCHRRAWQSHRWFVIEFVSWISARTSHLSLRAVDVTVPMSTKKSGHSALETALEQDTAFDAAAHQKSAT